MAKLSLTCGQLALVTSLLAWWLGLQASFYMDVLPFSDLSGHDSRLSIACILNDSICSLHFLWSINKPSTLSIFYRNIMKPVFHHSVFPRIERVSDATNLPDESLAREEYHHPRPHTSPTELFTGKTINKLYSRYETRGKFGKYDKKKPGGKFYKYDKKSHGNIYTYLNYSSTIQIITQLSHKVLYIVVITNKCVTLRLRMVLRNKNGTSH